MKTLREYTPIGPDLWAERSRQRVKANKEIHRVLMREMKRRGYALPK